MSGRTSISNESSCSVMPQAADISFVGLMNASQESEILAA